MVESNGKAEVFTQLRDASLKIIEGFQTIINIAPGIKLYNTLLESKEDTFLKSIMNIPDDIELNSKEIKFAVYLKKLYENGDLPIVDSLIKGNLDDVIDKQSSLLSNKKKSISRNENIERKEAEDRENQRLANSTIEPSITETHKDKGNDIGMKNDVTNYNNQVAGSETNLEANDIEENVYVNEGINVVHDNDDKEEEEEISELFTQVAKVNESNNQYLNEKTDSIYKRNRNFDVFKEDQPPKLPDINTPELLAKVFTHQSVMNYLNIPEESKIHSHNERLEFLGDAFLQFVISIIIYEKFPNFSEGQLSILRSNIVSNNRLLKLSQVYGFDKKLRKNFNDSSILTGNNKLYADVFEAYLGAIAEQYMMESKEGETNVNNFVKGWFEAKDWLEELCEEQLRSFDPSIVFKMQYSKSSKQDLRLLLGQLNVPDYIRCNISNKRILSCVKVAKKVYGYGIGTSNKEADSRAATDAMSNPGIRKICPDTLWKKFEEGVGVDESGALKFEQYPTKVSSKELNLLKREIATKYRNGDIKLLASKNNPISLLITDKEREIVSNELYEKHSISNTGGEILGSDGGSSNKADNGESFNDNKNITTNNKLKSKEDKKYPSSKYYSKEYTMGRGGIFNEEYKRITKKGSKHSGGIYRNIEYTIIEDSENNFNSNITRTILCHEVLAKCDSIEMDSKNRMNAIFARRGGIPNYITYKTIDDKFLCEMWFGNKQIVSYGLDKNKKLASQKAAMLAYKREEYYGYSSEEDVVDNEEDEDEEEEKMEDESEGLDEYEYEDEKIESKEEYIQKGYYHENGKSRMTGSNSNGSCGSTKNNHKKRYHNKRDYSTEGSSSSASSSENSYSSESESID